ncbi:MAG: succinylglutamate desuccinylase/aspartoacylase family protein, partial [Pseudomonadota bacterium]
MLTSYHYHTLTDGPHLLITGAVHGNEPCGTEAIMRLISQIENKAINLQRGTLTLIPICNPEAYKQNKRFIDRNLNRSLYPKAEYIHYEDRIDPILCDYLTKADILLDLHSYASQGGAFGFMGHYSAEEIEYCLSLGIENFVYGWSDAFQNSDADPREAMGMTEYARSKGAIAVTIECGQHLNKDAPDIAYDTILHALSYCKMIENPIPLPKILHKFVQMRDVFSKEKAGSFAQPWKHCDMFQKGDILAEYDDKTKIIAPYDGVIVLPKLSANIGKEWFYIGQMTECPD